LVDGVFDTCHESPHLDIGAYAVRIGDTHLYGERYATEDETYNISVNNVHGSGLYVILLSGAVKNLVLENLEAMNDAKLLLDERIK
jgi:hypothetical protein